MKEEPKKETNLKKHLDSCEEYQGPRRSAIVGKQETIEEAAEKYAEIYRCPATNNNEYCKHDIISAINFGAKWQHQQSVDLSNVNANNITTASTQNQTLWKEMYSEEDMVKFAEFVATYPDKNRNANGEMLHAKSKYDGAERTIDLLKQYKK